MHILLARYHLHLPTAHTLKEKRSVLKRILHGIRSTHNVSVAEVGAHDEWQHAELAIVTCAMMRETVEGTERAICEGLDSDPEALLGERLTEWL